jgi:hypothetical protein
MGSRREPLRVPSSSRRGADSPGASRVQGKATEIPPEPRDGLRSAAVLRSRRDVFVAEDYWTLGDAFFEDAKEAATAGADTAADGFLRRARACWWAAGRL